ERAVTLGKIADIHMARGEFDEALVLQEMRLPVAEQMGDIGGLAHILYSRAQIRLQRGDHHDSGLQAIYEDLARAYAILVKLGRPDGIGAVGTLLAQMLAMGGLRSEALQVLETAEAAWRKIGQMQQVARVAELRQTIGGRGDGQ
ncbi:MAG TPA: hypothetical protein PKE01_13730, partial [Rhodocyclaceae bacterium]|nr:hypothetical protein [Rhodocyclaceae bacterium]